MATEWATSTSVTVTIPSADSDDAFNEALEELAATAREFGQGDDRRIVAVEVDLIKALRTRAGTAVTPSIELYSRSSMTTLYR